MKKSKRIFSKYFHLIFLGFMMTQMISVGIYWLFVGKPLALKASKQIVSELVLQTKHGNFNDFESERMIWRPIPHFIKQDLSNHYHQLVTVTKIEFNGEVVYYFNILDLQKYIALPLAKLDFYPPQAMLFSLLLIAFISVLMAWMIARQIAVPIKKISASIMSIGDGVVIATGHISSIVELNDLQNKVYWMQSRINQLLRHNNLNYAGFSHDLKTPITQLNLALALIKSDISDKKFKQMQHSLNNMTDKIDSFIKQSKVLVNEEKTTIVINDLIDKVIDGLNHQQNHLSISVHCQQDLTIVVQVNRLKRVLENLINNALIHGQTNVDIEIGNISQVDSISFSIKDTGNIHSDKIKELNQSFQNQCQNLDSETNHSLGILICYQLAFQSSWNLTFIQNKPKGLTAVILIPSFNENTKNTKDKLRYPRKNRH